MTIQSLDLKVDGVSLVNSFIIVEAETAKLLILTGGANIPLQESPYPAWQQDLASSGVTSLVFNYRGVNTVSISLEDTSLMTRLEDSRMASKLLQDQASADTRLFVMGISMGAPLAIQLANELKADGLILASPAAYSMAAHTKNFGDDFRKAIREPNNWLDSPDFSILKEFSGELLLAYGSQDEVIPHDVLNTYREVVESRSGSVIQLNSGHSFMRADDESSVVAKDLFTRALVGMIEQR